MSYVIRTSKTTDIQIWGLGDFLMHTNQELKWKEWEPAQNAGKCQQTVIEPTPPPGHTQALKQVLVISLNWINATLNWSCCPYLYYNYSQHRTLKVTSQHSFTQVTWKRRSWTGKFSMIRLCPRLFFSVTATLLYLGPPPWPFPVSPHLS